MLGGLGGRRIFVYLKTTDFRKSFDGLSALISGELQRDVFGGDVFLFLNKRRTQVRLLYWDGDGFCLWMKRLERGTFRAFISQNGASILSIDACELSMLLSGVDAIAIKRRKRYVHLTPKAS